MSPRRPSRARDIPNRTRTEALTLSRWRDLYTWQPGLADTNVHLVRLYESAPGELPPRALCLRHFSRAPLNVELPEDARRPCRECLLIVATELARATTVVGMNLASTIVAEANRIGGEP